MTKVEAVRLVALLVAHYPQAQFSEASAQAYEASLMDLEFEVCKLAIARLVKTQRFMPSVAEIRAAACDVACGPRRLGAEAWGDVVMAIRRVGAYRPAPPFDDPGVAECVRLMGWRNLCLGENEAADRARFIELYGGLQERARADAAAGRALPPAKGFAALPRPSRELGLPEPKQRGER